MKKLLATIAIGLACVPPALGANLEPQNESGGGGGGYATYWVDSVTYIDGRVYIAHCQYVSAPWGGFPTGVCHYYGG